MTDRTQRPEPKIPERPPMAERDRVRGDRLIGEAHERPRKQPIVGEDVPDESKERHTEIAVEEGHHGGMRLDGDER
jgi:hypothetical protein